MSKLIKTDKVTKNSEPYYTFECGGQFDSVEHFTKFCAEVHSYISTTDKPELNLIYDNNSAYNAVGNYSLFQYLVGHHPTEKSTWNFINNILEKAVVAGAGFICLSRGWDIAKNCGVAQGDEILKVFLEQPANLGIDNAAVFKILLKPELYYLPEAYQGNPNAVRAFVDHLEFLYDEKKPNNLAKLIAKHIENNSKGDIQTTSDIMAVIADHSKKCQDKLADYQTQLVASAVKLGLALFDSYKAEFGANKLSFVQRSDKYQKFVELLNKISLFSQEASDTMYYEFYNKFGTGHLDELTQHHPWAQQTMTSSGSFVSNFLKKYEQAHGIKGRWCDYDDRPLYSTAYHQAVGVVGEDEGFYEDDSDDSD